MPRGGRRGGSFEIRGERREDVRERERESGVRERESEE